MGDTPVVTFPPKDHPTVYVVVLATAAFLASATWIEEGSAPLRRLDEEYACQVFIDIIRLFIALSGSGKGRSTIRAPHIHHPHQRRARGV